MEDIVPEEVVPEPTTSTTNDTEPSTSTSTSTSRRPTISGGKFEVEKFDGTNNFGMWQCEVMDVLIQQELDIALEDKPADMDDKEWKKLSRQACGTIRLCLAKDQKYSVMRETDAKTLWQTLEHKYMSKSLESRLYLRKKLLCFQLQIGMSMSEHIDKFTKLLADLQNLDDEIKDEDKALILLNSLPESYEHLCTTIMYGKEKLVFADVSSILINNEYRKKDKQVQQDSSSEALTARGRSQSR